MKRILWLVLGLLILLFVFQYGAVAFHYPKKTLELDQEISPGIGNRIKAPEVISGEIFTIDEVTLLRTVSTGLQIIIETDDELIPAYLGPKWGLEDCNLRIQPGDKVIVQGIRVPLTAYELFVVNELTIDGKIIQIMTNEQLLAWREMTQYLLASN